MDQDESPQVDPSPVMVMVGADPKFKKQQSKIEYDGVLISEKDLEKMNQKKEKELEEALANMKLLKE